MICNCVKTSRTVNNEYTQKFRELLHCLDDERHRFPRNRTGIKKMVSQCA